MRTLGKRRRLRYYNNQNDMPTVFRAIGAPVTHTPTFLETVFVFMVILKSRGRIHEIS